MTREEREQAIAILENEKKCVNRANKNDYCNRDCYNCELVKTDTEILTALDMAMQALEQEPSDDCVSRANLISKLEILDRRYGSDFYWETRKIVDKLPSVKPQEKTGHWIEEEINEWSRKTYCSKCGESALLEYVHVGDIYYGSAKGVIKKTNYCPNCGAKMD